MNDSSFERQLEAALGIAVRSLRPVRGGDINDAYAAKLADGQRVFVKTSRAAPRGMYEAERKGLEWIGASHSLRVPFCLAVADGDSRVRFLVLEWIEPGQRSPRFDEELGLGLAALHRSGAANFGWDSDNFIGPLPQSNRPQSSWARFYAEERLRPQLDRAVASGRMDSGLQGKLLALLERIDDLVGPEEPPARLHGDLWSGNVHADPQGQPCLIDPAVYGGHREMDLAMLQLFGHPTDRFFAAYDEVLPLAEGWRRRVHLHQLYPLLVHVNLFGRSYVTQLADAVHQAGV